MVEGAFGTATILSLPTDWEPIPTDVLAGLEPVADDDPAFAEWADELITGGAAGGQMPASVGSGDVSDCAPCAAQLAHLETVDVATASDQTYAHAIEQLDRLAAHVEGLRLAMVAALAGPEPVRTSPFDADWSAHEVAMAMRISLPAADRQVALARHLGSVLSASLAALTVGRLSFRQVQALHDATAGLPDDVARRIEARVLSRAGEQDIGGFRRSLRRAVAALDPEWTITIEHGRRAEPRVDLQVGDHGASDLWVTGPTETIAAIHTALSDHADATKKKLGGTTASRMLHALHDWATRPGQPHGHPATVDVLIDLPTLLGLTDHPAEVVGYGPIPSDAARALLGEGAPLRRLVTDPISGQLLDYGRRTYTVPKPLAHYLAATHQTSRAPHSHVPANRCDIDHHQAWAQGGHTDRHNLIPLDRRWHRAKTHAGYTYNVDDNGVITWTSPHGLTAISHPPDFALGP